MKKVKYISTFGNQTDLTNGKIYDVIGSNNPILSYRPNILVKCDKGTERWYYYSEEYFEDITIEYNRNQTINDILNE